MEFAYRDLPIGNLAYREFAYREVAYRQIVSIFCWKGQGFPKFVRKPNTRHATGVGQAAIRGGGMRHAIADFRKIPRISIRGGLCDRSSILESRRLPLDQLTFLVDSGRLIR